MFAESLAIIAVILLTAGIFVRARKKAVALLTLPLMSVPLFYLSTRFVQRMIGATGSYQNIAIGLMTAGAVLGSAACSLLSLIIPTRKGRTGYITFCLVFQVAVTVGYLINIL